MNKKSLPIILLRGIVVLPYAELKIDLIDELDTRIIELASQKHDGLVLLVSPENYSEERIEISKLPNLGIIGKITKKTTLPNGCIRVTIEGVKRAQIDDYVPYEGENDVFKGIVSPPVRYAIDASDEEALLRKLKTEVERYINIVPYASNSILSVIGDIQSVSKLADVVANYMPTTFERKYEFLITVNPHTRVMMNLEDIQKELDVFEIEKNLDTKLKKELDNSQKEFILREKIRLIKEELGDISSRDDDVSEIREKVKKLKAPKNVIDKINREIKKYESTPSASPEVGIIRNYLDVLTNLPWNVYTKDNTDLKKVKKVLDDSHYGLSDIKERIIEYLAVKKRSVSGNAPIICLVGPPGVGKTSLAKSIADAMNRKFVKISVGGVNDPAEIIGHRRTYMGANPGRIINALKKSGSSNPVFLIDEVDKMTKDIKGDPASSLLEVLDPEQNATFYDNYVEEPYDLSKVMFILTANYIDQIPEELKDRLEIIRLSSYTEYEKLFIAKKHLIKLGLEEYALDSSNIKFSDEIILKIIEKYTKEAGVRELKRMIDKVIRRYVKNMIEDNKDTINVRVTDKKLEEFLGKPKYENSEFLSNDTPGIVNGLAYTSYGGDILPLEVVTYESKDKVKITGNLGDVMKESAFIALGHIKSHAKEYKVDLSKLDNLCIHINAIEAAIPKDGPSAGMALTTAVISSLLNVAVPSSYAMTGEMTLTGKVLAIGGLKEKITGAYLSGARTFIIPKKNERDLDDIPKEVMEKIKIIVVNNYKEIYDELFNKKKKS